MKERVGFIGGTSPEQSRAESATRAVFGGSSSNTLPAYESQAGASVMNPQTVS
jgi:hypothetical protein